MALFLNNRQNGMTGNKKASATYTSGMFLTGTSGVIVPVTSNTDVIFGISNENISSTDPDYAVVRPMYFSEALNNDEIIATVTGGGATAALEQKKVDIDVANPENVTTTTGTQFLVTKVVNGSTVIGKVALAFNS